MRGKMGFFNWPSLAIALILGFAISLSHGLAAGPGGYVAIGAMITGTVLWGAISYIPVGAIFPIAYRAYTSWADGRIARARKAKAKDVSRHFD